MSSATEGLKISLYSILVALHLRSHLWQVATASGSAVCRAFTVRTHPLPGGWERWLSVDTERHRVRTPAT